jgi:hypothetical protein
VVIAGFIFLWFALPLFDRIESRRSRGFND